MSNMNVHSDGGNHSGPRLGEAQIYLAHIGMDDYAIVKANIEAFNLIVRYCGGIPQTQPMSGMCASLVFTTRLYREDFAREMHEKLSVTVCIDFREIYVDRRKLPLQANVDHTMDRYDFARLVSKSKKAEYEKAIRLALHPEEEEPEYIFPDGEMPA